MGDRPLVLHVVYRFDVGGLENGVVNLINHMPEAAFRHAVVALTDVTAFGARIRRPDVELIALHKPPGHGVWLYPRLWALMRRMKPAIVHTRNLAALEAVVPAWLAGVPVRIHGEHGRDMHDLDGNVRRYQWARRLYRPFVSHYVALSADLAEYMTGRVGVAGDRVSLLCNGVDTQRFTPAPAGTGPIDGCPFSPERHWLLGTVGRMQEVKDPPTLARAFVRALELAPTLRTTLRLVMVGDGPLRATCLRILDAAGATDLAWLPGERTDIPAIMRGLHAFVLPSLAEGVSNTILEALASAVPVVATDVGANAHLVRHGETGHIVPCGDVDAMARAIVGMASEPEGARRIGAAARADAERRFSLQGMVSAYQALYEKQLSRVAPLLAARREA